MARSLRSLRQVATLKHGHMARRFAPAETNASAFFDPTLPRQQKTSCFGHNVKSSDIAQYF